MKFMLPSHLPSHGTCELWMSWTTVDQCVAEHEAIYGPAGTGPLDWWDTCEAKRDWDIFRGNVRFPVGDGTFSVFQQGLGLPQMVAETAATKEDLLSEAPVGDGAPQDKRNVRMTRVFKTWKEWFDAGNPLPEDWNQYPTPESYPGVAPTNVIRSPVFKEKVGPMDLGIDLKQTIQKGLDLLLQKELGPDLRSAPIMPAGLPAGLLPALKGLVPGTAAGAGTAELIDYLQGKKKKRRRRRRLATVSDIKDLAALRSVLGNGEAFKTWIATHSR